MNKSLILLPSLLVAPLQAQAPLSLHEAIERAWSRQSGLMAGQAMVEKAQAEAESMRTLRLPSLTASAGITRTDEPMMAFGTKLDQARITMMDFSPASLNHPEPITGAGALLTLSQPIYAGGRLDAARRAGQALAQAESASQGHRRQQVALAVAQAYFGTQVAEQAVAYAEDTLTQARETERFVQARVEQGLMLKSEADRTRAFRAQSEAGLMEAKNRVASARSALALLTGAAKVDEPLSTTLDAPGKEMTAVPSSRGDLEATRLQAQAAQEGVKASLGSLKPEVGLNLTAGTARYAFNAGGNWTTVSLGAKWSFSFSDTRKVKVARAQARAAELNARWQEAVASREVQEARRAVDTAQARIEFAQVALEASESVRAIRTARHREGLLPLVEVLDAESGLSGARTLLLNSQLEWRVGKAQLALALGQPIEGIR